MIGYLLAALIAACPFAASAQTVVAVVNLPEGMSAIGK